MHPIRVINSNFELVADIELYETAIYKRSFTGVGTFEIYMPYFQGLLDVFGIKSFVIFDNNVHKVGIVKYLRIEITESGREQLIVGGRCLKSILQQRIVIPPAGQAQWSRTSKNVETVIKDMIADSMISAADADRNISFVQNAASQNRGSVISWDSRYYNLMDEVEKICNENGMGVFGHLDLTNKKVIFDVVEIFNTAIDNGVNPPVIFSKDYDDIKNQTYIYDTYSLVSDAFVAGQGEGVSRTIVEVGSGGTGIDRIESFIDARDIADVTELTSRGNEKLLEAGIKETFESSVLTHSAFQYGSDWDLGYKVTVVNSDLNKRLDTVITEVVENYSARGLELQVTFGDKIPNVLDKIKQDINKPVKTNI
ncbi:MAG: hypothetical protein GT589_03830 [Peptoclostridium sp.]|uniref:siphovirus ReqiPepy6 Gp37-like family protein n=1 Tax=Peptoclostridium sp. TaxID=1904860 RepID=UPI00139DC763|nr:siphovirus ReqiPepy6 Gp37-like family protein [Peptoclostridium sp.]MZQ75271.1 hypothetical protein [Peptoclostridium sp.]